MMEEGRKINARYPSSAVAHRLIQQANIPYGCAVVMTNSIRLETAEQAAAVLEVLNEVPFA